MLCLQNFYQIGAFTRIAVFVVFDIKRGEIRRMAEDKYTHRYMCPWYPIPDLMKRPQTCPAA